jgi:hypothetical protein
MASRYNCKRHRKTYQKIKYKEQQADKLKRARRIKKPHWKGYKYLPPPPAEKRLRASAERYKARIWEMHQKIKYKEQQADKLNRDQKRLRASAERYKANIRERQYQRKHKLDEHLEFLHSDAWRQVYGKGQRAEREAFLEWKRAEERKRKAMLYLPPFDTDTELDIDAG